MLTAEIKVNGKMIANIIATQTAVISDKPGDFIGDRATVYEYSCVVEDLSPGRDAVDEFTVLHDRRLGWQGLLNTITEEVMPLVIDTVSLEEDNVKADMGI